MNQHQRSRKAILLLQQFVAVDDTWTRVKNASSPFKIGQAIALSLMEIKVKSRSSSISSTSSSSPSTGTRRLQQQTPYHKNNYDQDKGNMLCSMVDLIVSLLGPDLVVHMDEKNFRIEDEDGDALSYLRDQCRECGVQVSLFMAAVIEAVKTTCNETGIPFSQDDLIAWEVTLHLVAKKMLRLVVANEPTSTN